jgi:hypothetical protein
MSHSLSRRINHLTILFNVLHVLNVLSVLNVLNTLSTILLKSPRKHLALIIDYISHLSLSCSVNDYKSNNHTLSPPKTRALLCLEHMTAQFQNSSHKSMSPAPYPFNTFCHFKLFFVSWQCPEPEFAEPIDHREHSTQECRLVRRS